MQENKAYREHSASLHWFLSLGKEYDHGSVTVYVVGCCRYIPHQCT